MAIQVASPAPTIPRWNPKIKMGSRITFNAPAPAIPTAEIFDSPSAKSEYHHNRKGDRHCGNLKSIPGTAHKKSVSQIQDEKRQLTERRRQYEFGKYLRYGILRKHFFLFRQRLRSCFIQNKSLLDNKSIFAYNLIMVVKNYQVRSSNLLSML